MRARVHNRPPKDANLHIVLPSALKARVENAAAAEDASVGAIVRRALVQHLGLRAA